MFGAVGEAGFDGVATAFGDGVDDGVVVAAYECC